MATPVQLPQDRVVSCAVTEPPWMAPYFPQARHSSQGSDLYLFGVIRWFWSPTARGYASPHGEVIQFNDDGTWERYNLGPPYYTVCKGTWTLV